MEQRSSWRNSPKCLCGKAHFWRGPKWVEVSGRDARIRKAHTGVHSSGFLRATGMVSPGHCTRISHLTQRHPYSPSWCLDPRCIRKDTQTSLVCLFSLFHSKTLALQVGSSVISGNGCIVHTTRSLGTFLEPNAKTPFPKCCFGSRVISVNGCASHSGKPIVKCLSHMNRRSY